MSAQQTTAPAGARTAAPRPAQAPLRVLLAGHDLHAAARALSARGIEVSARPADRLDAASLGDVDVLVYAPRSPGEDGAELTAIEHFVLRGGGLVVVLGDGDASAALLARLRLDQSEEDDDAQAAVALERDGKRVDLLAGVRGPGGRSPLPTIRVAEHGEGHVAIVGAGAFGEAGGAEQDHETLWLNVVHWVGIAAWKRPPVRVSALAPAKEDPQWWRLRHDINALRRKQRPDGSVDLDVHDAKGVADDVVSIVGAIRQLARFFPHQQDYVEEAVADFERWVASDLTAPDFSASLARFRPSAEREDGIQHLAIFPMYKQNGSPDATFEALVIGVAWPAWLAEIERSRYPNPSFVPGMLLDYTAGYNSACAVLFPEMISAPQARRGEFGVIFCDREAERFRSAVGRAIELVDLSLPPDAAAVLESPLLSREAFQLWDLIHDHTHHHGYLPFESFMSRQRAPYWMYTLEELRCDLVAYCEAVELEHKGLLLGRHAQYVILLDRLLRFPLEGVPARDYDGLAGQVLFGYLYKTGCLRWRDDRLRISWEALPEAIDELRTRVEALYRDGVVSGKLHHWNRAHELVAEYVPPAVLSRWATSVHELTDEPASWTAAVLPDEFPHSLFYLSLRRRLDAAQAA